MAAQLDFLVEIGTEELPPKALKKLSAAFADGIEAGLQQAKLSFAQVQPLASPRRLAVKVSQLAVAQPDQPIERRGPALQAAFDADGTPTKAAQGFARSCGVSIEQLERLETPKGSWLAFRSVQSGQPTQALLPAIVEAALTALPIPKRMRWGSSREEFVRPVHWLVMLFGNEVVDCTLLGQRAGRTTYGHRFHYNQPIELSSPAEYESKLQSPGYVVVDFAKRRTLIHEQVMEAALQLHGHAVIDEELLDEVTGLVEWPVALTGNFDKRFLEVPAEALVSSMKEHQKYFHVVDKQGRLMPHFITLSNIESQDPAKVIAGNERVIRPRLADAAFFFETDRKTPLEARTEALRNIVFQAKLGTLYDKTQRVAALAAYIAEQIGSDARLAERAGRLSKADLVSDMVLEFPELQGIMGYHYALHDGEVEEVAQALNEQYMPRHAGDRLPETLTGCALAIADRLDTLVGIFGIGQPPSGDKDPFALRRASIGILHIIVEKELTLDLRDLLTVAQRQHGELPQAEGLVDTVLDYMLERFRAWYQAESIPAEAFLAVRARPVSRPLDFDKRVKAVHQFSQRSEAEALAAANKRVSNILTKQGYQGNAQVDHALLQEPAEIELAHQLQAKQEVVAPLFQAGDYAAALNALADLRAPVDHFFDQVMVMADDAQVRNNRLALLASLRNLFLEVADISLLQQ